MYNKTLSALTQSHISESRISESRISEGFSVILQNNVKAEKEYIQIGK
jgi:hypothetical protein